MNILRMPKDNEMSEKFRREGNCEFMKKNAASYLKALKCYNKCICFAENGSKQLAIGYANRSAAYFEINLFKDCLANIEMARNVPQYPDHLEHKLAVREAKCRARLAAKLADIEPVEPVLSYPPHEKIPFVANCVEIRRNVKYGRHLVANRDLKVGDIVAIEEPFCTVVSGHYRYSRCEHCTEEHARSLIPCESCTAVMFCSVECRTEAKQSYHKYECTAIDMIKRTNADPLEMLPVRLVLTALAMFDGVTKALHDYAEGADLRGDDTTVFEIDYTKRLTPFAKLAPVYCMGNGHADNRGTNLGAQMCINLILHSCKFIDDVFEEPTNRHLMKIMEHVRASRSPSIQIATIHDTILSGEAFVKNDEYQDHSRGVYPFHFLLNHSCAANVIVVPYGKKLMATIARPVKAGQQLFRTYCSTFYHSRLGERRSMLAFQCTCVACKKDYPLMEHLPWSPIGMPDTIKMACQSLRNSDPKVREKASKAVQTVADYLHTIDRHVPCMDSALASQAFWTCFLVLHEKEDNQFYSITETYMEFLKEYKPCEYFLLRMKRTRRPLLQHCE